MQIFFSEHIVGDEIILPEEESAHCIRVMRLTVEDIIYVINGKGGLYEARIEKADSKACHLKTIRFIPVTRPRKNNIHIAISPTKNIDRFEWFVEKAVEIGIDAITPILCQRSERKVIKTERLQKLVLSTMKQAIVTEFPLINELTPFDKFIKEKSGADRFIAHCEASPKKPLAEVCSKSNDTIILIGPEGDFSPQEISLAETAGFIPVSLGSNRLRTETAGIVACCIMGTLC